MSESENSSKNKSLRGKIFEGVVVGNRMNKTVVVEVERTKKVMPYGKYIRVRKKYLAHAAQGEFTLGEKVLIRSSRPISKRKHWVVAGRLKDKQ